MKDRLEEFIHQNRQDFDDKEPSGKVWRNIEASMMFSSKGWWNSVSLWRAAAVIFMALSIYLIIPKPFIKTQTADLAAREFKDVEDFYFKQISEKVELIDGFQKNEGLNGFTQDFQQLEAMYMILKVEMKTRPCQKVKDAFILNLIVRNKLLNHQLYKLDKAYDSNVKKKDSV
jgi:hypothetical protein